MNRSELARIARAMVVTNRGILAADESSGTIKKRFDGIKLESTEENRRTYRELLFTAPGVAETISGVILYDETIRQKTKDGVPFSEYLA
jgi:fructose-bisphosphate aldolase class I